MAGDWKNKTPNQPYVDSQGRYSVVLIRDYLPTAQAHNAQVEELKKLSVILEMAREGFQRLMQKSGKIYNENTWQSAGWASAPSDEDVKRFGTVGRATLASAGISELKWKAGVRGFDCEGPYLASRPGVAYALYNFSIHKDVFENYAEETYPDRTGKILESAFDYYKEIEFDSYEDLSMQLAEVAAVLEEYEGKHKEMQTQSADKDSSPRIFRGPEVGDSGWPDKDKPRTDHYGPLNLVDEAERLNVLNAKIKDFLKVNDVDLYKDKIVVGFYPVADELNPAVSFDETEDAGSTEAAQAPTPATIPPEYVSITKPSIDPEHYTDKYEVQEGDNFWSITKFYLETGGARYSDIIAMNYNIAPYRDRASWISPEKLEQMRNKLRDMEDKPYFTAGQEEGPPIEVDEEYIQLKESIEAAKNPELNTGDVLNIPIKWLYEIAERKGSSWKVATVATTTLAYKLQGVTPVANPTGDGPPLPPTAAHDPWWYQAGGMDAGYHSDAQAAAGIGQGKIAYFKIPSPEYTKAVKNYKQTKNNFDSARTDPDGVLLKRKEKARDHINEVAENQKALKWRGFMDLVYSKPAQAPRTLHFLTNLDIVVSEPGVRGSLVRFCSPNKKPPKKAKKISVFVKKYIYDPPKAVPFEPSGEDAARDLFDARAIDHHTPRTEEEFNAWNAMTKNPLMKTAIARRNSKFTDHAGDAVFAALPRSVDKISGLGDIHRYVLSRMDLPRLAEELVKCLGGDTTLNEVIDALCDGFLKKLGIDPDQIDAFFKLLRSGEFNLEMEGVELIDTARLAADLQSFFAEALAAGVDDPFYSAVIRANVNNADGKRLICELIMGVMYIMADFFANLEASPQHLDALPPTPRCNVPPSIWIPPMPNWGNLLYPIFKKLEQLLYSLLDKLITWAAMELMQALMDACAEELPEFGAPPPPVLPGKEEDFNRAFNGTGVENPKEFLANLLSTLTQMELCRLISGTAPPILLLHVRKFMRVNYPEFYNLFYTDDKVFSFFKGMQGTLDLSMCVDPTKLALKPEISLNNLCKDGTTPREEALRRSLLAKGLTPEQVEEQLDIDRQIKKDLISAAVAVMFPSPMDDKFNSDLNVNSLISGDDSPLHGSNARAVNTAFNGLNYWFGHEAQRFSPTIKSNLALMQSPEGGNYKFVEMPAKTLMQKSLDSMSNSIDGGPGMSGTKKKYQHMFEAFIESVAFNPGGITPKLSADGKTTTHVETEGEIYIPENASDSQKKLTYNMREQNHINFTAGSDEAYNFTVSKKDPDTKKYEKKFGVKEGLYGRTFIDKGVVTAEIKKYDDRTVHGELPKQVDVWLEFLKKKLNQSYNTVVSKDTPHPARQTGWYGIDNLEMNVRTATGTTDFPTRMLAQKIYNLAFESLYSNVTNVIMGSPAMDMSAPDNILFTLDLSSHEELSTLNKILEDTHTKVRSFMEENDFTDGRIPTYISQAIFEGAVKTLVKVRLLQRFLAALPVYTKFNFNNVMEDSIFNEYVLSDMVAEDIKDGFLTFYKERHAELRRTLEAQGPRSTPPQKALTEDEINTQIGIKLYADSKITSPEAYYDSFAIKVADDMKRELAGLKQIPSMTSLEEEIEAYANTQEFNETDEVPGMPAPKITGIKADNTDLWQKNGSEKEPATRWTNSNESYENQIADEPGHQSMNTWSTVGATLMQQHFSSYDHGGPVVEVPNGTTIGEYGGTNYYPGVTGDWLPLPSPKIDGHGDYDSAPKMGATRWFSDKGYSFKGPLDMGSPIEEISDAAANREFINSLKRAKADYDNNYSAVSPTPPWINWLNAFTTSDGAPNLAASYEPYPGIRYHVQPHAGLLNPHATGFGMVAAKINNVDAADLTFVQSAMRFDKSEVEGYYIEKTVTHEYTSTAPKSPEQWKGYTTIDPEITDIKHPVIRLRVPVSGHEKLEVFTADFWQFTIEGNNFHPEVRVFLVGQYFNQLYELPVNAGSDWQILVKAPIQSYGAFGAIANREAPYLPADELETTDPNWTDGVDYNTLKVRYGHGHFDEISGKPVVDDIYSLVVQNPDTGKMSVAPVYFHTFTPYGRSWNGAADNLDHYHEGLNYTGYDSFDKVFTTGLDASGGGTTIPDPSGEYLEYNPGEGFKGDTALGTPPAGHHKDLAPQFRDKFCPTTPGTNCMDFWPDKNTHPQEITTPPPNSSFGPRPWEKLSAMTFQGFPIAVRGTDTKRWDVVDVADVIAIKKDKFAGGTRETLLCKPRLFSKKYAPKLTDHGGFILEKFVKIKFKSPNALKNNGVSDQMIQRIYGIPVGHSGGGLSYSGQYSTLSAFKEVVAVSGGEGSSLDVMKIHTDEFELADFTEQGSLVVPAQNEQILPYDAFVRLYAHLLGIPPDLDTASAEIIGYTAGIDAGFISDEFNVLLSHLSYGLRVSYVLPLRGEMETIGDGNFSAALMNMFSPTSQGAEELGNLTFQPPSTDQRHLTKVKALHKAYHLTEFQGTGEGGIIPDVYGMPISDFVGGLSHTVAPVGSGDQDITARAYAYDLGMTEEAFEARIAAEATLEDLLSAAVEGTEKIATVAEIQRDVFVLPLVSASLESGEDAFPTAIRTFPDILLGYPSEQHMDWVLHGKPVFDVLYTKLRNNPEFKMLFEYVFPSKRMLALNTIYTMESFDDMFPNGSPVTSAFKETSGVAETLARDSISGMNNPAGGLDIGTETT